MIRWRVPERPLERIADADLSAPLLAVVPGEEGALLISPVDAEAALRLPAMLVASALERFSLQISNAVLRVMTATERRSVSAFARFPVDRPVRSFSWPISFREADQPVPAVLRAFAGRVAGVSSWSVAGLAHEQRLAACAALEEPLLTRSERDTLTASLHWSL